MSRADVLPQIAPFLQLSEKQLTFVRAITQGASPTTAAKAAGAANATVAARRYMATPAVQSALAQISGKVAEQLGLTKPDVLAGIKNAILNADTAGEQIQGWKEIGRMLDYYAPEKVDITHRVESATESELKQMSTDELAAALGRPILDAEYEEIVPTDDRALGHEGDGGDTDG